MRATTAPNTPPGASVPTGAMSGFGEFAAVRGSAGQLGPTVAMIQENRALMRDLMEIPESLTIRIQPGAVTFIDDLSRARTYSTEGERQRYQLGAARFNAVAEWSGVRLHKLIDAADGFRMSETYLLSEDNRRLFVIVRVGSDRKNAPIMGVNRVYDRASIDGAFGASGVAVQ
jgi:hypothetical protein